MSCQKKTSFNENWLTDSKYSSWVRKVSGDQYKAKRRVCQVDFQLGNMGKQALTSHAKGKKHKSKIGTGASANTISSFLNPSSSSDAGSIYMPITSVASISSTEKSHDSLSVHKPFDRSNDSTISDFVLKDDVLKAEVLWALKTLVSHYSCNSSSGTNCLPTCFLIAA